MRIEYDEIYGRDQQLRVRARFHARHEILLPEFRDPFKLRDVSNIALPGVLGVQSRATRMADAAGLDVMGAT